MVWALRRTAGSFEATLDHNCVVVPAGAGTGEFEVTATAGAFTDHAVASVVTADRYRDLVAAQLESSDAGVEAPAVVNNGRVGAVAVTAPAPTSKRPSIAVVLVALSALLAGAGAVVLLRRRKRDVKPVGFDTFDTPQPAKTPSAVDEVAPTRPAVVEAPAPVSAQAPAVEAPKLEAPVAPPRPAVIADALTCPKCATRYPSDLAFCPQDGASLVPSSEAPRKPESVTPPTVAAPDGVCPVCGRRYPAPTEFCGEDGATLVRAQS